MRYRKPFTLIKRGEVWFYRSYGEYGRRTTKRSTGQTNKTVAERYCLDPQRRACPRQERDRATLPRRD